MDNNTACTDVFPILVYRKPTLKDTYGSGGFAALAAGLLVFLALLVGLAWLAGARGGSLWAAGLFGLVITGGGVALAALLLRPGQVELHADELVDTGRLGKPLRIRYEQIREVRRGAHSDQVWVRYHPLDNNGLINLEIDRGQTLTPVQKSDHLRAELTRRVLESAKAKEATDFTD